MNTYRIVLIAVSLILLGVCARLLQHAPNATPITALALVGGWYLGKRWAVMLPLLALVLSDVVIGFYDWKIMLSVYGSFALIGVFGWLGLKYRSIFSRAFLVVGAPFLFFLITNAAVWLLSPWYPKTVAGLVYAYELGLPFLRNMLAGDIVYVAVLVLVFELGYALSTMKRSVLNVA